LRKIALLATSAVAALCVGLPVQAAPKHRLLIISVDGLDWRYLRDADQMGLKIPTFRKLLAESPAVAEGGVLGIWPTITWPSHTTMLTGVRPDQHGIIANASGKPDPVVNYWAASKIKVQTLYQCAGAAGYTSAAINWPVTVNAQINWVMPEVYNERNGETSDMATVVQYSTPGLIDAITTADAKFPNQWFDDESEVIAARYIITQKHPDLMMIHLGDLDGEQHAQGPFTWDAKGVVERMDNAVAEILAVLPKDYDFALVSDHGFEAVDHIANLKAMAAADGVTGDMSIDGGLVTTTDVKVAAWLKTQAGRGDVGREVPHDELTRIAPLLAPSVAAYEPAPHVMFGKAATGPAHSESGTKGNHGFWPARPDYHSVFLMSGPGVAEFKPKTEIPMLTLASHFQDAMGLKCEKPAG
jgi:predicted AlkP superfamily pyrophosphatase or phosphodiesterase